MLRVSLNSARPGMVLAQAVAHPLVPQTTLLQVGVRLEDSAIPKLRELGVHDLWIEYPGMEDLVRFVDPRVLAAYHDLTVRIGAALDAAFVQSSVELDFFSYRRAVMGLVDELAARPQAALFVTELAGGDRPFLRHSGNVCVLSLLMGLKLDFYLVHERSRLSGTAARDISGLGVGAMFHDLGMTRLSTAALARWNHTQNENDPEWRQHSAMGYDMVKDHLDPAAAGVVLHHHQRFDGTGFPVRKGMASTGRALAGSEIHIFARIAACAELFDRLRNPAHAPHADESLLPSRPAVRALAMLLQEPYRNWIDPMVFKALITVAPPYPPGSIVTLSDGRLAAVVGWSPEEPCRPTVETIQVLDHISYRRPPRPDRIDLRHDLSISIAEIDGHDVRGDNFAPRTQGEFDLAWAERAMVNRAEGDLAKAARLR